MLRSRVLYSAIHPMQYTLQIYHTTQLSGKACRKFHTRALLYYASKKDASTRKRAEDEISFTNVNEHETFVKEEFQSTDFSTVGTNYPNEFSKNASFLGSNRRQRRLEELYPDPVNSLYGIFQIVENELNTKDVCSISSKKSVVERETKWECSYDLTWPQSIKFVGSGQNKKIARRKAALKCIHWLEESGKLKYGKPQLYKKGEIQKIMNRPVELIIPEKFSNELKHAVEIFERDIQNILENPKVSTDLNFEFLNNVEDTYRTGHLSQLNYRKLSERFTEKNAESHKLPIFKFREKILDHIHNNQSVLIKGDTGCGKTTQVPQFILDQYIKEDRITDCNIIVSQPRRISAMSLASRVAEERGEEIGGTIGYQVRLDQVLPQFNCGIRFCTTGILLRKMQFNPSLKGFSHIILDEAHERSVENDMLMVLLKRALQHNRSLKLIVMSATINSELVQNYFQCPVVQVPGFVYPVKMHFLDEMQEMSICKQGVTSTSDKQIQVDHNNIKNVITWICKNKPPGAILCFLPGWADIVLVWELLTHSNLNTMILPIHSKLSHQEQKKIFGPVPDGSRKIILATDIAETGITVNDVVYVVDSAIKKEVRWDEQSCVTCMDFQWVSQANIMQRRGRAGRVRAGESFHFISRDKYRNIDLYPQSEVLRIDLEKVILDSKKYSNEKAIDFFSSMPESPSETAIYVAVDNLKNINAIDDEENLTFLGKRMLYFTLHPRLSKAIVYSSIFNCIEPIVTISSQHSMEDNMFTNTLTNKYVIRKKKQLYNQTSDHIAMLDIYHDWESKLEESYFSVHSFCNEMEIVPKKLRILQKIRGVHIEHLVQSRMVPENYTKCQRTKSFSNGYAAHNELIRGLLFSATNQLIRERNFTFRKGRFSTTGTGLIDLNNKNVHITQESVNYKQKKFSSPFLTYIHSIHCNQRHMSLVRETSVISPLTVFLFSREFIQYLSNRSTNVDDGNKLSISIGDDKLLNFCSDLKTITLLSNIRSIMWDVVDYILQHQGLCEPKDQKDLDAVIKYKNDLLYTIADMLLETSKSIDSCKHSKQDSQTFKAV